MAADNILQWLIEVGWEMMESYRAIVLWLNETIDVPGITLIFGELRRYEFMFGAALPVLLGFIMIKFILDAVS